MTDFTPAIKILTLPPNASHTDPRTEITSWVDYNINASRGTTEFINPPYPAQSEITLLFDDNVIPDVELGTWMEVAVYSAVTLDYEVMHSGYVTNRTSRYRAYGLEGFVLEWSFSITSAISVLQNTEYYEPDTYTLGTSDLLNDVITYSQSTMWNQVNANTTWANYGPTSWANVDALKSSIFPDIIYSAETTDQKLYQGYRNTWDDITTLIYGLYGYIWEEPNGDIHLEYNDAPLSSTLTLTQDMMSTDIVGGDRFDTLRNQVTIVKENNTELVYFQDESVGLFGPRTGTLTTYLFETLDAADVGQKILNSLAYPILSTEQISVNLLNPVFTDAEREILLFSPIGRRVTVEAPAPMGGTLDYLVIGLEYQINKNAFILDLTLAPYSQVYNTINWDQVPYNYTWTSYGVAFPTQKWQDL